MSRYERIAGLETHIELSTRTKIFCGCTTAFGGQPNTHCCPVCTGQPGALPRLNREVVKLAVQAGLATGCTIHRESRMDRKHYHYPDLPRAYQITQYDTPLCTQGQITLSNGRIIRIDRIHIEEDAGKSIHQEGRVLVDYNRSGVPLIEVVTAPDFRSAEEMREYLEILQRLMRAIGVSDCRMQEGSLRCDVNLSVRQVESDAMPTRTEIKNMNSFSNMVKAVNYEWERQIALLEQGEPVVQETRRYDESTHTTQPMRDKENSRDYRYFREPDLTAVIITDEEIAAWRAALPELPEARMARYIRSGLPSADAELLVKFRRVAEYFDEVSVGVSPRTAANFVLGPVFARMTDADKEEGTFPLPAEHLRELTALVEGGRLSKNLAKTTLERMMDEGKRVTDLLSAEDMAGVDDATLQAICQQVVENDPKSVADYQGGKEKAMRSLIGGVMRATRGKADPQQAEQMLREMLSI